MLRQTSIVGSLGHVHLLPCAQPASQLASNSILLSLLPALQRKLFGCSKPMPCALHQWPQSEKESSGAGASLLHTATGNTGMGMHQRQCFGQTSAHRQLHCQARICRHSVQRPGWKLSHKRILRQIERLLEQQAVQDAPGARQECPKLLYIGGHLPCELIAPNTEEACG